MRLKLILATIITFLLLFIPQAQAGDVLDFLPEVQLARSLTISAEYVITTFEECEGYDVNTPIPDNLLIDENGQFRTREESGQILLNINCLFQAASSEDPEQAAGDFPLYLNVLGGESVTLSSGFVIDGTKQSIRVSLVFPLVFFFLGDLFGDNFFSLGILGDDPCGELRDFVINGSSIELQWLAAFTLSTGFDSESNIPSCVNQLSGLSEVELIALTQNGDVDAALTLANFWIEELIAEISEEPTADDLPAITAAAEEFKLFILANSMKYPLLTLAASIPLTSLEAFIVEFGAE